ncbi:MAG: DUF3368 domain-containing protein [bacterium]|nr:DUF3368 domain-containing protein [bacterium]
MDALIDNTVLSNFAVVHGEDWLRDIVAGVLFIPQEVLDELAVGESRNTIPARDWSWIQVLPLESEEEHLSFLTLRERFGDGESACLSLAIHRHKSILTDDLDVRKYAQRIGIPVSGTIGVLVRGVRQSVFSLETANDLLARMIEHGYYSPFQTLDSLLSGSS